MSRTGIALVNLRASVILLVVGFHSVLAYLASQHAPTVPFDSAPYDWRAVPIVDEERWLGFDLFCAWQYVFLMPFMFFLSGLFVWPSLQRKGSWTFLHDRFLRLGVPFVLGVYLLMPLAHYPVYRVTAVDPGWSAFWSRWMALPFSPSGPLWFLWQLLVLDVAAAALYHFAPRSGDLLTRLSSRAGHRPGRYFAALVLVSGIAYLPLAAMFKPWQLAQFGPFAFQPGRLTHYVVYFLAGVGVGSYGLERGLLGSDGLLARQWGRWLVGALVAFALWLGVTALTMNGRFPHFDIVADLAFVVSSASACFCFAAVFLRFAVARRPLSETLAENAYGMYLVHYGFAIWLQYALLSVPLLAAGKAAIVFTGTLLLSWTASTALCRIPLAARLIRSDRRTAARAG